VAQASYVFSRRKADLRRYVECVQLAAALLFDRQRTLRIESGSKLHALHMKEPAKHILRRITSAASTIPTKTWSGPKTWKARSAQAAAHSASAARVTAKSEIQNLKSLLQKSWHGHLAREKRLFSWQIPAMNHGQDARATLFAGPSKI
jgi:hypothetical protein